ncbi:hypothetical protein BDV59DRAFT_176529 [Aspergillus ambiguus]|uniref:uncharacterized protein n=1 Tax=Aspergillus ambiguus TaxID=176160 RepID=UPI003CCD7EBA
MQGEPSVFAPRKSSCVLRPLGSPLKPPTDAPTLVPPRLNPRLPTMASSMRTFAITLDCSRDRTTPGRTASPFPVSR